MNTGIQQNLFDSKELRNTADPACPVERLVNWSGKDCQLLRGDCLVETKKLESNSIDLALLDPPYKLGQKYTTSTDSDNLLAVASIYPEAIEMSRVVKKGHFACVVYDNRILPLALDAFKNAGWKYIRALTLYRRAGNASNMCGWMSTSDLILLFQNGEGKLNFYGKCSHDVYVKDKMEKVSFNHPAQKPEWLIEDLVQRMTVERDTVFDPYMGSGTTGVVCKRMNRKFIGIELDGTFFDTAAKRIQSS